MNNRFPSRDVVESLRKHYPVGCRVELVRMDDPQAPPIGTKGTAFVVWTILAALWLRGITAVDCP